MEAHTTSTVDADEVSSASRGTKRDSPEQSSGMMTEDIAEDNGAAPEQNQGQGGEHTEDERRGMEEEREEQEEDCADKSADQPQDEASMDGAEAAVETDSVAGGEEEDGEEGEEEEEDVEESEHRPPILDGRNVRCTTPTPSLTEEHHHRGSGSGRAKPGFGHHRNSCSTCF